MHSPASQYNAVTVNGLGKRFRIGADSHDTLRDQLANLFRKGERQEKREYWALRDINFQIPAGEAVGVVGRNGAGKSTLLKLLSQISEPTCGEVRIRGRVATLLEVGTGFHPELSGRENVFLNGAILGMSRAEIRSKFDEIVEFAGVEEFLDTPVKRYSSGMYVRLAFAVAAHLESEILIVDEVLAVGDASFQSRCLAKMDEAVNRGGRTVLFVSHNLAAVQRLCTTGIFLEHGALVTSGPIGQVLEAYQRSLGSGETSHPTQLAALKPGEARFADWELAAGADGARHTCHTGSVCEFRFTLLSRADLDDVNFGFVLWNAAGELIVAGNTNSNGMPLQRLSEGNHLLTVHVRLPIKAGLYGLDVSLTSKSRGQLERAFLEPKLHVLPPSTTLPEKWQGLITEPVEFQFTPK